MYIATYTCHFLSGNGVTAHMLVDTNRQLLHREICLAYGNIQRCQGDIIYRCIKEHDRYVLIVQSAIPPVAPIKSFTLEQCDDIEDVIDTFREDAIYRFELLTVPNYSIKGKKHYLSNRELRMNWLCRQGEKHGFSLGSLTEEKNGTIYFDHSSKQTRKKEGQGSITQFEYKGLLQVTDAAQFKDAFRHGIGSGKAYGLGMLMLRPAR